MLEKSLRESAHQMLDLLFEDHEDELDFYRARDTLLEILCRKGNNPISQESCYLSNSEDFNLIASLLKKRLDESIKEAEAIRYYLKVDSSSKEDLPKTLKNLPYEEIEYQLNPWLSMVIHYENMLETFKELSWKNGPC
jgi:hypothetical protein